jgi:Urocanase Rossmann-like domain
MASNPSIDPALSAELEAVYALYAVLAPGLHPQTGLGGKLIYAGELDVDGCRLVRAANIAGAASLSAAPHETMQRSAIRGGVVDFVVTSLDEALRILKNEIRKCNAVSVGVSISPTQLVIEMSDRGVLPDLLRSDLSGNIADFISHGAQLLAAPSAESPEHLVVFPTLDSELEQRVLHLIPDSDCAARRWLRVSHRYLGPQARRLRSVPAKPSIAAALTLQP